MVGVDLKASWQASRKVNNDATVDKVQKCISSWRAGKFMPLVCRPFSINTYCLSKVWFRSSSVDLRVRDITEISKKIKSYCYQDLYQKPCEVTLYRPVEKGGLGLYHVASRAKANLISTFIQTACGKIFQQSLFHSWLYRYHVLREENLPNPGTPPYYGGTFFQTIREVNETTGFDPVHLTVKQWYQFIVERDVLLRKVDDEDRMMTIPCKIEKRYPLTPWTDIYRLSRLKGLSSQSKSFLFKLVHEILPSNERINHLNPNSSSLCRLNCGEVESYEHLFFQCVSNSVAAEALLRCLCVYDQSLTISRVLSLNIQTDECFELAILSLLSSGLELIWTRRLERKSTNLVLMRSDLEWQVLLKRKSRNRRIGEAANIMLNIIENNF